MRGRIASPPFDYRGPALGTSPGRRQNRSVRRDDFTPVYRFGEMETYRLYFDPALRNILW